jgi:outer membrane lipoprotein-sorting protein
MFPSIRPLLAVAGALLLVPVLGLAADDTDYREVLRAIDRSRSFDTTDFSATFTVVSQKPDEETSVFKAQMFRRDAEDKFVMVFLEPDVQRGQGYLQVDDNLWFYDPESRKFSHSSLRENLQDSEARNSDLNEPSLAQDYDVESAEAGRLGRYDVHILDLTARHNEVSFPRLKMWVRQDNNLMLKVQSFSLSGRLVRSEYFPKYVRVEGRFLASQMLFVDELNEGERTQVTMANTSLARVPDSVFSKSYLERVNR